MARINVMPSSFTKKNTKNLSLLPLVAKIGKNSVQVLLHKYTQEALLFHKFQVHIQPITTVHLNRGGRHSHWVETVPNSLIDPISDILRVNFTPKCSKWREQLKRFNVSSVSVETKSI